MNPFTVLKKPSPFHFTSLFIYLFIYFFFFHLSYQPVTSLYFAIHIYAILTETLGEHAPWYGTVKNWVAQFKCGNFSTCDAPHPGRPKTVTTLEIIDQIHELILKDHRMSAKSIA